MVAVIKNKVDELESIKSIFVTKLPKKNAFQTGDIVPKTVEEWADSDYGLEVSGINVMDELRVLAPGLEYQVESCKDNGNVSTITLVLNDAGKYGRLATGFDIWILRPDVVSYTIKPYEDGNGNVLGSYPSAFTGYDTEQNVTVYVYTEQGWILDGPPRYGFTNPLQNPSDTGSWKTTNEEDPKKFTISKSHLIPPTGNTVYLWANFIKPTLMLTSSDGSLKKYYTGTNDLSLAIGSASAGDIIHVMSDISVDSEITISKSIKLQVRSGAAAPVKISRGFAAGSLFKVGTGGTLTLTGGSPYGGLVIDGAYNASAVSNAQSALVKVDGGVLNLEDGATLKNNYNGENGDGMGGGVYVAGGSFTMSGGQMNGNRVEKAGEYGGGGVYVGDGVFTMSGGVIDGNHSKPFGGGVLVSGGYVSFTGGKIYGNEAQFGGGNNYPSWAGGGGIFVNAGSLVMGGGAVISGNRIPNGGGGGVVVSGSGYFEMSGGKIMQNDTIHGWIAGGGVMLFYGGPVFKMSGGTIAGNKSNKTGYSMPLNGAGVFLNDGTFILSGGPLITQDNDVRLNAYSNKEKTINIGGSLTTQNVAKITLQKEMGSIWHNDYRDGRPVLTGTSIQAAAGRFSLGETGWFIDENGKLSKVPTGN
jgi:hypothetical protein